MSLFERDIDNHTQVLLTRKHGEEAPGTYNVVPERDGLTGTVEDYDASDDTYFVRVNEVPSWTHRACLTVVEASPWEGKEGRWFSWGSQHTWYRFTRLTDDTVHANAQCGAGGSIEEGVRSLHIARATIENNGLVFPERADLPENLRNALDMRGEVDGKLVRVSPDYPVRYRPAATERAEFWAGTEEQRTFYANVAHDEPYLIVPETDPRSENMRARTTDQPAPEGHRIWSINEEYFTVLDEAKERTVADVEAELAEFKEQVATKMRDLAQRHGWCQVAENALAEIGLEMPKKTFKVRAVMEFDVTVDRHHEVYVTDLRSPLQRLRDDVVVTSDSGAWLKPENVTFTEVLSAVEQD